MDIQRNGLFKKKQFQKLITTEILHWNIDELISFEKQFSFEKAILASSK